MNAGTTVCYRGGFIKMARCLLIGVCALTSISPLIADLAQTRVPVWEQHYHGPGTGWEIANGIVVATNGTVFVTGFSSPPSAVGACTTVAYSKAGVALWTNRFGVTGSASYETKAIVLDHNGDVIVAGGAGPGSAKDRYLSIKYSAAGLPLWTNLYTGPYTASYLATGVVVDTNDNVFVTGFGPGIVSSSRHDFITIAYSSTGTALWTNRYDGPVNGEDTAEAMAVDAEGDLYVTGSAAKNTFPPPNPAMFITIKYSNAGVPLWTNRFGLGSGYEAPTAMVINSTGNVVVTGIASSGATDYATVAYSKTGVPLWTNRYHNVNVDFPLAIAADQNGNVFVTGYSQNGSNVDYLTIAYSNAGLPLWTNRYNGTGNGTDMATAVAVRTNGNVIVTGRSSNGASQDFVTIEYSPSGVPLAINRRPAKASENVKLALTENGDVYITGSSTETGPSPEFVTIRYSDSLPLAIAKLGNDAVLTWSNSAFALQSAPTVTGAFTNIPGATSPYTNFITGPQQFFRLISE